MHERPLRLRREALAKPVVRDTRLVLDVRRQDPVVALGEHLGQPGPEGGVLRAGGREGRAERVPSSRAVPIGTIAVVRRSEIACRTRSSPAPGRSILFTKISVGMRSRCSARIRMRVCGCTPSTAEITSTAPSSTLSTRSTSAMKSGWPGVSIRLTVTSSIANDDDRRLDRDAALALERQRVGLRRAVVDAADLVDDTGGVEQPLGERRLTGVYMRQDPQVQRFCEARVIPSE